MVGLSCCLVLFYLVDQLCLYARFILGVHIFFFFMDERMGMGLLLSLLLSLEMGYE